MVGSANSLGHILSEDEQTQAANGRQIYSLFDDEQDWAGLLNGLEQPDKSSAKASGPEAVSRSQSQPQAGGPRPFPPPTAGVLSYAPSDPDLACLATGETSLLTQQSRLPQRQSPPPQAVNLMQRPSSTSPTPHTLQPFLPPMPPLHSPQGSSPTPAMSQAPPTPAVSQTAPLPPAASSYQPAQAPQWQPSHAQWPAQYPPQYPPPQHRHPPQPQGHPPLPGAYGIGAQPQPPPQHPPPPPQQQQLHQLMQLQQLQQQLMHQLQSPYPPPQPPPQPPHPPHPPHPPQPLQQQHYAQQQQYQQLQQQLQQLTLGPPQPPPLPSAPPPHQPPPPPHPPPPHGQQPPLGMPPPPPGHFPPQQAPPGMEGYGGGPAGFPRGGPPPPHFAGGPGGQGAAGGAAGGGGDSSLSGPMPADGEGLAEMAKDPKGSRQLQLELPRWSAAQLKKASEALEPHLFELSKHTFGNYAVSKLATLPPTHPALTRALRGNVVELLQHPQGSRVVQAAMSALPASETLALVHEIDGHILECSLDTHGSFGVCVSFRHTHAPFILQQLARHISALSTQQHGCRVVQSVLQAAAASGMDLHAPVQAFIDGELLYLAAHPYGNYGVQVALRHCSQSQRDQMLSRLLPRCLALSASKHGSNVAELLLVLASAQQIEGVRASVFGGTPKARQTLRQLLESPFGNYVLQTLLRRLSTEARADAIELVRQETTATNFGRSILARLSPNVERRGHPPR